MNRKAFTITEVSVVIVIFLTMIAMLGPFVRLAKMRRNKIECTDNLMQISLGLHRFAADHNDAFPEKLSDLFPNYVADERVFDCPANKARGNRESPNYVYTPGLSITSQANEIIVQDIDGNHKKTGKNVLRVNGAIDWIGAGR